MSSSVSASSGDVGDNVTIVIRSGMQAFSDRKITCSRKWTILQLKEHLSRELSFKPEVAHQRLIYSGHFLDNTRTIDSVLVGSGGSAIATDNADPTTQVFLLVYTNKAALPAPTSANGAGASSLRHRPNTTATASNGGRSPLLTVGAQPFAQQNLYEYYAAYYQNYMNQMSQAMQQQFMAATGGVQQSFPMQGAAAFGFPPAGHLFHGQFPLTPGVIGGSTGWPQAVGGFATVAPQHFAGPYPAALAAAVAAQANAAQGGAQPVAGLQARGGPPQPAAADNVADGAAGNRLDFLEMIYKAFRFLLLATLIYGYSSFERFLAVILAVVLLWFVQMQRNQREAAVNAAAVPQRPLNPDANEQRQEAAPTEENREVDADSNQADAGNGDGVGSTPGSNSASATSLPQPSAAIVQMNAWTLAWSTVCSFFTSLVPEHHVAIE